MPRIYKLSRTGLKILYKIRHHRGHGIHSPFVFNLVTKVIEEKTPFHIYDDIEFILRATSLKQNQLDKTNKLLFRLINYFGSKHILEIGSGYGINTLCLTAPSKDIKCICVESSEKKCILATELYSKWQRDVTLHTTDNTLPYIYEKQDCIVIDLANYNNLPPNLNEYLLNLSYHKTFIIIKGIRTNRRHQMLWRSIRDMESRTVALDLFNIGIVFFDPKLYRWDYKISF